VIKAAVLGSPISHSLSPALHRAAYRYLGVEGTYEALDVKVEDLPLFVQKLDESWTGFSLTMPLKEKILEIAHDIEPLALTISSANTLIRSEQGWRALTTDVNGFRSALAMHGVEDFTTVAILGSGATARAAACAFDGEGRSISVIHRSPYRELAMRRSAPLSNLQFLDWDAPLPPVDLLINTTPHGVADEIARDRYHLCSGVLFEALYDPWPTLLLSTWKTRGLACIDGLDLLVHQGIDQISLMTRLPISREDLAPVMRQAGMDELLGRAERNK
jgi:shikimate dehydrogenase